MRQELLSFIHCPICAGREFTLRADASDDVEIREGEIKCLGCSQCYPINEGIVNLLVNPTKEIINEQQGWTELEQSIVNTDELMLALPDAIGEHKAAWRSQADNFHYMWSQLKLTGKERVLDLGSGRCWSTRFLAQKGCYCVGIDILLTKYVGLRTADVFIHHDHTFFERICGDMNRLPFHDGMFDLVFITATLHHASDLRVTTKEISRVLKPTGQVVLINEPVVGLFRSRELHCPEIECGINEHVYPLLDYIRELRRAHFTVRIYPYIGGYTRVLTFINRRLVERFPKQLMPQLMWRPLLHTQLLLSGGILNLVATTIQPR